VVGLLAELLADAEAGARTAAARALGCCGQPAAVPLLRYKALCGDAAPLVLSECLGALLLLEREHALPFLRRFLDPGDETRADAAALALGQSRLAQAVPLLIEYADEPPRSQRKAALYALAMLREPEATEYLLALLRDADVHLAGLAIEALGMHRYDTALHEKVRRAAEARRSPVLSAAVHKAFP
jgi:HEAT repeat protein